MATIAERIEALSGHTAATGTTDLVNDETGQELAAQWMTDGFKDVVNIISKNTKYIDLLTSSNTLNDSNGVTLTLNSSKLVNVVLYDGTRVQECRLIPASRRGRVSDINDLINYATTTDPVYWIKSGVLEVFPTPTDSNYALVESISYPTFTVGDAGSYDITAISSVPSFPNEAENLVILYAAIKATEYMLLSEEDQEVYGPQLQTLKQDYQQEISSIAGPPKE